MNSDIIYKYTDRVGAEKILSTNTLKFTSPLELNDPFDVYVGELMNISHKEFCEQFDEQLIKIAQTNPAFLIKIGVDEKLVEYIGKIASDSLKKISDKIGILNREIMLDLSDLEEEREKVENFFRNKGVFCATKKNNNLLMWAHYAESHKGVVLGFKPDLEKDSFLKLIKPVEYSSKRPFFFDPILYLKSVTSDINKVCDKILYTKSVEWSYEEELRMTMPRQQDGKSYEFLTFHKHELEEIYLGYRIDDKTKVKIINLAQSLNPNIKIFKTKLSERQYALEFNLLV